MTGSSSSMALLVLGLVGDAVMPAHLILHVGDALAFDRMRDHA